MNNFKKNQGFTQHQIKFGAGFTIIESLVAITILILAVTGAASVIQTGISSYIFSKDQIIAFYLAQEGFEQIRNIRDENSINNKDWLTDLTGCFSGNACTVSPAESSVVTVCSGAGNCPVLRQNPNTGFFGYDLSWTPTIFKREIVLTQINANETSILVTIDWSKGLVNRQFRARENILDWQ